MRSAIKRSPIGIGLGIAAGFFCVERSAIVAALLASLLSVACADSRESPTASTSSVTAPSAPLTSPAPVAVLSIIPNSFGDRYAIAGQSHTHFDGSQSRGEGLTYLLEFGDGDGIKAPVADHILNTDAETRAPIEGCDPWFHCHVLKPRLTVTDRYGRVDSVTTALPLFPFTFSYGIEFWNWASVNPVLVPLSFNPVQLVFDMRRGASLTGTAGDVRFVGTLQGERDVHLTFVNGVEYDGWFDYEWNGTQNHWSIPTKNRLVLTQTKGADVGRHLILYIDTYA